MSSIVKVAVVADTKPLRTAFKGLGKSLGLNHIGKAVKGAAIGIAAATAVAAAAAIKLGKDLIDAGERASTSDARITQVATSMGLFGKQTAAVSKRVAELSNTFARQTGVDQNTIKLSAAKLLTFKELGKTAGQMGGLFERATKATVDMAAAGFGTAEANAVQLGKALNDPIKGITALAKSGVTFTEAEKHKIKTLVESNKLTEAQGIIMSAVEKQVGGVAAATANTSDKIKVAWSQVQEQLGQQLLPAFETVGNWLVDTGIPALSSFATTASSYLGPALASAGQWIQTTLVPAVQDLATWAQTNLVPAMTALGTYLTGTLIPALMGVGQWIVANSSWLIPLAVAIAAIVVTWKLWTAAIGVWTAITKIAAAAQAALNTIMRANPIGLVITAIVGLVAFLVTLYNTNSTARNIINSAWAGIKTAVSIAVSAINGAINAAIGVFRAIMGAGRSVASALSGAWNSLRSSTGQAIGAVASFFGSLPGRIWSAISSIPGRMAQLGRDMISGLVGALSPGAIITKIKSVIGDALGWAKRLLGISSPSRVFRQIGRWSMQGMALGLGDTGSMVISSTGQILHRMTAVATRTPRPTPRRGTTATDATGPTINVYALTPTIETGRVIAQALDDYYRSGGRR